MRTICLRVGKHPRGMCAMLLLVDVGKIRAIMVKGSCAKWWPQGKGDKEGKQQHGRRSGVEEGGKTTKSLLCFFEGAF